MEIFGCEYCDFIYDGEMNIEIVLDLELCQWVFLSLKFNGFVNVLIFVNVDVVSGVCNILKMCVSGLEVGLILMGMGNCVYIVSFFIIVCGLLNMVVIVGMFVVYYSQVCKFN